MFGAKLTFLVSLLAVSLTSVWSTYGYSFEEPIKFYLSITEAPINEPLRKDSICDNMDEDERKRLCENEAIAVCGRSHISVEVDPNKALGKTAMYTFHADTGFQLRGSRHTWPACSCPTTPTIYFREATGFMGPDDADVIRISVEKASEKLANKKRSSEPTSSSSESAGKETKSRRRSPRFLDQS